MNALTLLKCLVVMCFCACAAQAASILYTFNATTRATLNSPAHLEYFELKSDDFLPLIPNGGLISFAADDPALESCIACATPPTGAIYFLRSLTSDLVQFRDADGTLRLYTFPLNALSQVGSHATIPGINVNVGAIEVAEAPEPTTFVLTLLGVAAAILSVRNRRPQ